jgi:hypothetical protein
MPSIGSWGRYFGKALNFRLMMSTRFLLVVLLLSVLGLAGCASTAARRQASEPPAKGTFRVSGYVLDAVSRRPVPGVEVKPEYTNFHNPAQTDSTGHFVLHFPAIYRKLLRQVVARTICYEGKAAIPADTMQSVTLLLKRNAFRFKPYGCQHLADSVYIPRYSYGSVMGYPGSQLAFLIQDSTIRQAYKLRAVTIRIGLDGLPREPMRLHLYQYNDQAEAPPTELLMRENLCISQSTEGVYAYDLSWYNIMVSGGGFFVVLEYIVSADKFYTTNPIENYLPTGPVLHPPCSRADIRTWEYFIGKGWHRATSVENCWPLYESAVSVEVEAVPGSPTGR